MKKTRERFALTCVILIANLFLLSSGCWLSHKNELSQNHTQGLVLADFDFVRSGMTIDEISERLGPPQERAIYMFQYELADGSLVIFRMGIPERVKGIWILRKDGTRVNFFTGEVWPELSLSDFEFLRLYMPYDEVIEKVGEPHIESGSGIHSAVYELADGGAVILDIGPRQPMTDTTFVVGDAWINSEGHVINFFDNK